MIDHLPDATKMVLSPAAQAVDRAIADRIQLLGEIAPSRQVAAAALQAAADQVKHEFPLGPEYTEWDSGHDAGIYRALNKFLSIAAELEVHHD